MPSPFPGMDPYIEARGLWEDFHTGLIGKIADVLAAAVPERYTVRVGVRPYVVVAETEGKQSRPFLPDVGIASPTPGSRPRDRGEGTAVAEPETEPEVVSLRAFIATEFREQFIEIYLDEGERYLATCIEILSPSNKRPGTPGWDLYVRKRQALLLGEASLVEIDLLRGGQKMPMLDPYPSSPYTLLVARRERSPYCRVWRAHSQRPLPVIPVPLVSPDPDVPLALQPLIEAIYARSRYAHDVDYSKPLQPPLPEAEAAWLAERIRAGQPPA
jgi:hypothetical protein